MTNTRSKLRAIIAAAACIAMLLIIPAAAGAATRPQPPDPLHGLQDANSAVLRPISDVPVLSHFPTTGGTDPVAITAGSDGNIWYSEFESPAGGVWQIGRLTFLGLQDGAKGSVSNFSTKISTAGPPPHGNFFGITAGPDGNLWYTGLFGMVGRVTPSGVASFQTIKSDDVQGITAGPDKNLWFTDAEGIGRITPHGIVKPFSTGITPDSLPLGITVGPDHNLWFTEFNSGKIGRITPQGVVSEFQLTNSGLYSITTGPDGNLWVTDISDHSIFRIIPSKCSAQVHGCNDTLDIGLTNTPGLDPGLASYPGAITAGPDGQLWFTNGSGALAEISTSGHVTPVSPAITSGANDSPQSIAQGPDGTLWYTETGFGEIGEVSFCSSALCQGQVTVGSNSAQVTGSLRKAATVGVLVQRREGSRLVTIGHQALGHHPAGTFEVRWPLRVNGRRLAPGRYLLTLRALNDNHVIDKTVPTTITVPASR